MLTEYNYKNISEPYSSHNCSFSSLDEDMYNKENGNKLQHFNNTVTLCLLRQRSLNRKHCTTDNMSVCMKHPTALLGELPRKARQILMSEVIPVTSRIFPVEGSLPEN